MGPSWCQGHVLHAIMSVWTYACLCDSCVWLPLCWWCTKPTEKEPGQQGCGVMMQPSLHVRPSVDQLAASTTFFHIFHNHQRAELAVVHACRTTTTLTTPCWSWYLHLQPSGSLAVMKTSFKVRQSTSIHIYTYGTAACFIFKSD